MFAWFRKKHEPASRSEQVAHQPLGEPTCYGMQWLARPVIADGVVVAEPLNPANLTDAELPAIGLRLHAILDTIEMPRCEGRLIPAKLFDAMDGVPDSLRHPGLSPPSLAEWIKVVSEF